MLCVIWWGSLAIWFDDGYKPPESWFFIFLCAHSLINKSQCFFQKSVLENINNYLDLFHFYSCNPYLCFHSRWNYFIWKLWTWFYWWKGFGEIEDDKKKKALFIVIKSQEEIYCDGENSEPLGSLNSPAFVLTFLSISFSLEQSVSEWSLIGISISWDLHVQSHLQLYMLSEKWVAGQSVSADSAVILPHPTATGRVWNRRITVNTLLHIFCVSNELI